jgi:hypothetical protein
MIHRHVLLDAVGGLMPLETDDGSIAEQRVQGWPPSRKRCAPSRMLSRLARSITSLLSPQNAVGLAQTGEVDSPAAAQALPVQIGSPCS